MPGTDGGGEVTGQFDAVPPQRVEPSKRERHGVDPWAQIDDAVLPAAVGDDRAHFLDERRTRGFYRHSRQHGARRIADDPGD
jgi:hypothetical protein